MLRAKTKSGRLDGIWQPGLPLPGRSVLRALAARCGEIWDCPDLHLRVRIEYNPRLQTTLGRAMLEEDRVDLNVRLLRDNPLELIPTLAHELAHMVVFSRYGKVAPHGRHFRVLMHSAGLPAETTHGLSTDHLKVRRGRYIYLHKCNVCGVTFIARRVRRNCYCRKCGPTMVWDVWRAPDSASGLKQLREMAL
jgi:SprT protein